MKVITAASIIKFRDDHIWKATKSQGMRERLSSMSIPFYIEVNYFY